MHRFLHGLAAGAATIALLTAPALAGDKGEATPLDPVSVTLENTCDGPLTVKLGALELAVAAASTSEPQSLPGLEKQAYELRLAGPKPADLGLLGMAPGGTYHVKFMNCIPGGADVVTANKGARPEGASPQAAAQIRFRSLNRGRAVEYKAGKKGRFKKLAVGYTSYEEQAGGDFMFTLRLRGKARGPVMGMRKDTVKLEPGHKYLIESNIVGRQIKYKFEDEGFVGPDGK